MALGSVSTNERGETERLLSAVVSRLQNDGVRVVGALSAKPAGGDPDQCNCDLRLLPDGPVVRITQELGAGSTACRMDAGALEQAAGIAAARLEADGADLVVLNKFGLSEAEGRGFRALIGGALLQGVPVLIGLSDAHRSAFEEFADGTSTALPAKRDAILDWCRDMVRHRMHPAETM